MGLVAAQRANFNGKDVTATGLISKGASADIVVCDFDGLYVLPDEIVHDLLGGERRRIQRAAGYNRPNSIMASTSKPPKAFGLTIPPSILARADEVIE